MTVLAPPTLQPISESPERRAAAPEPPPRFVKGHARRRSAPPAPPQDPTLDPATALVLAQARLSAAQAEATLQKTAADGLRAANAGLREENARLGERVRALEAQLADTRAAVQPLTPTGTASSSGAEDQGPAYVHS